MNHCVNHKHSEVIALSKELGIHIAALASEIAVWQEKNNQFDRFPTAQELNLNPNKFVPFVPETKFASWKLTNALNANIDKLNQNLSLIEVANSVLETIKSKYASSWNQLNAEQQKAIKKRIDVLLKEKDEEIERFNKAADKQDINVNDKDFVSKAKSILNKAKAFTIEKVRAVKKAFYTTSEERNEALLNKIKQYYAPLLDLKVKDRRLFGSAEEIEREFVSIFQGNPDFCADIEGNIEKLSQSKNYKTKIIGDHLKGLVQGNGISPIISLAAIFNSYNVQPYYFLYRERNKNGEFTEVRPANDNYQTHLTNLVYERFRELEENYNKDRYSTFQDWFTAARDKYIEERNKLKTQKEKNDYDANFMEVFTGISKEDWLNKWATSKSFKKDDNPYTRIQNFLIKDKANWEVFKNSILYGKKFGSPINTIVLNTSQKEQMRYVKYKFKGPDWNQLSSIASTSALTHLSKLIGTEAYQKSKFYANNLFVKSHAGRTAIVSYIAGVSDRITNKSAGKELTERDVKRTLVRMYLDNLEKSGGTTYKQIIGQFGEDSTMPFVDVLHYNDLAQLKEMYKNKLKEQGFSAKFIKDQVSKIEKSVSEFHGKGLLFHKEDAELFVWNNAYNYNEVNEFYNGNVRQYLKKGIEDSTSIAKQIAKRNASLKSPGIVAVQNIKGGVPANQRIVVIKLPETSYTNPATKEKIDFKWLDGQSVILRKVSDQIETSTGQAFAFGTVTKAITNHIDPATGNRFLDKTNSIVIDEYAERYPNTIYGELYRFMVKNNIDKITTVDGAKLHDTNKTLSLEDLKAGKYSEDKHLFEIPYDTILFQQELANDGKFSERDRAIQEKKNAMIAPESAEQTKMYNEILVKRIADYLKTLNIEDQDQLRSTLLDELKKRIYNETSGELESEEEKAITKNKQEIIDMLEAGTTFDYPPLNKWIIQNIANKIQDNALGQVVNGEQYVEMAYSESKDFKLEEYEIDAKSGKVKLGTCAVAAASNLRPPSKKVFKTAKKALEHIRKNRLSYEDMFDINDNILEHELIKTKGGYRIPGEYVKVIRIPADDMHSHALLRVKYLLPSAMKNVVITPHGIQHIAGSDFDGDKRTMEGFFKIKEKVYNEDGTRKKTKSGKNEVRYIYDNTDSMEFIANRAFKLSTEWYYKPENIATLYTPIDTETNFKSILNKLSNRLDMPMDGVGTYVKMRKMYNVGLLTATTMFSRQGAFDFIRQHSVNFKQSFKFPKLTIDDNGKITVGQTATHTKFDNDLAVKAFIGNVSNAAIDNGNLLIIDILGLNEVSVNWYLPMLQMGYDIETCAAFFNDPFVKDVVEQIRNTNNVESVEDKFGLFNKIAEELGQKSIKAKDVSTLTQDSFNNTAKGKYEILIKLHELERMGRDMKKISDFIRAGEKTAKTFTELYNQAKSVEQVTEVVKNKQDETVSQMPVLDTINFSYSPYSKAAKASTKAMSNVMKNFSHMFTKTSLNILRTFEKRNLERTEANAIEMNATDELVAKKTSSGDRIQRLNQNQLNSLVKAIESIIITESRNIEGQFSEIEEDLKKLLKKFEESPDTKSKYKPLFDMLQWNEEAGKIRLKMDFRINDIPNAVIEANQKLLEEMYFSKDPKVAKIGKQMIDYIAIKYNLVGTTESGSFAFLLSPKVKADISKSISATVTQWKNGHDMDRVQLYLSEIVRNNPDLNFSKVDKELQEGRVISKEYMRKTKVYELNRSLSATPKVSFEAKTDTFFDQLDNEAFVMGESNPNLKAVSSALVGDKIKVTKDGVSKIVTIKNKYFTQITEYANKKNKAFKQRIADMTGLPYSTIDSYKGAKLLVVEFFKDNFTKPSTQPSTSVEKTVSEETKNIERQIAYLEKEIELLQNKVDISEDSPEIIVARQMPKINPTSARKETGVKVGSKKDINPSLLNNNGLSVEAAAENIFEDNFEENNIISLSEIRDMIIEILQIGKNNFINKYKPQNKITLLKQQVEELKNSLPKGGQQQKSSTAKTVKEIPNGFSIGNISYSRNTDDKHKTYYYVAAPFGQTKEWEVIKKEYAITKEEYEKSYIDSLEISRKEKEQQDEKEAKRLKELESWNNENNIVGKTFPFNVGKNEKGMAYEHSITIEKVRILPDGNWNIIGINNVNKNTYDMVTEPDGNVISYTRNGKTFKGYTTDEIVFGYGDYVKPITSGGQQQKSSTSQTDTEQQRRDKVKQLQKAFPGIKIVEDTTIEGLAELSEDGETIKYNPNYNKSDTMIHEFGHALIDVLGGLNNKFIKRGVEQLRNTKLWNQVKAEYRNLSEEMLAKEVLAQAIGKEGALIWKEKESKSKFQNWLSEFYMRIKRLLGIEKNVARNLASQLLAGKKIAETGVRTGMAQQQRKTPEDITDAIKTASKSSEFKYDDPSHSYTLFDKLLTSVTNAIKNIPKFSYTGPEREDHRINSDLGKAMHSLMEGIVNGLSKEELKNIHDTEDGRKFTDDDKIFDYIHDQLYAIIKGLQTRGGSVITETKLANAAKGIAGTADIIRAKSDGTIDIFDLKTSINSTLDEGYTEARSNSASTQDKHGIQLATYGRMLELGEDAIGLGQHQIDTLNIIPLRITIKKGKIVSANMEPLVTHSYEKYKYEAITYILPEENDEKQSRQTKLNDAIQNWQDLAFASGYDVTGHERAKEDAATKIINAKNKKEKDAATYELNKLKQIEEEFKKKLAKFNQDKKEIEKLIESTGDLSQIETIEELLELERVVRRYDVANTYFFKDILNAIALKMKQIRIDEMLENNPDYDFEAEGQKDLTDNEVFGQALSDVDQSQPMMQYISKEYSTRIKEAQSEHASFVVKGNELLKDLYNEYWKGKSATEKAKNFFNPLSDNSYLFDNFTALNIESDQIEFKKVNDPSLKPAERAMLKHILDAQKEYMSDMKKMGGVYTPNALIKINPSLKEHIRKYGFFTGIMHNVGLDYSVRNVRVNYTDPLTGKTELMYFDKIHDLLSEYADKGILQRVKAIALIVKYRLKAKRLLNSGAKVDEEGKRLQTSMDKSDYSFTLNGRIKNKFSNKWNKNRAYSRDFYKAASNYVHDMSFSRHMSQIVPMVEAVKQISEELGKDNVAKYLDIFKRGQLFGESITQIRSLDQVFKILRGLTHLVVMPFNWKVAGFNYLTGKWNQIYSQEFGNWTTGEQRMVKNYKKTKNIAVRWKMLSYEPDLVKLPNIGNFFSFLSEGVMKTSEMTIQITSAMSQLSEEHYDWFDDNGDIKGTEEEIEERTKIIKNEAIRIHKKIQDVQGKYGSDDKRNYQHYEIGKLVGQYKIWMPDIYLSHLGSKKYTRSNEWVEGNVRTLGRMAMGTYRSIVYKTAQEHVLSDMLKKEFWESDTLESRNMRKNAKEAIGFCLLWALYLGAGDDDDDKEQANLILRYFNEVTSIYNLNSWESAITKPVAAMGTVEKLFDACSFETYKTSNKYHDEGDFKAVDKMYDLIPYKNMIQTPVNMMETFGD